MMNSECNYTARNRFAQLMTEADVRQMIPAVFIPAHVLKRQSPGPSFHVTEK